VLVGTQWGIGASPDSITYIAGARSLAAGLGYAFNGPITHFPPMFSTLLSFSGAVGVDPLDGARWIQAFLLAANIVLTGSLIYAGLKGRSSPAAGPALAGAVLVAGSVATLEIHLMAWSEPAFLVFGLGGLAATVAYLVRPTGWRLAAAAALIGLAFLTRLVGAAFVAAACTGLLVLGDGKWGARLVRAAGFGGLAAAPMGAWTLWNLFVTGAGTDRSVLPHGFDPAHIGELSSSLSAWFLLPQGFPGVLKAVLLGLILAALAYLGWTSLRGARSADGSSRGPIILVPLLLLFAGYYALVLVLSNMLLKAYTPLDSRILSPLFVVGTICTAIGAARFLAGPRRPAWISIPALAAAAVFVLFSVRAGAMFVQDARQGGLGFNSRAWRESRILEIVKDMPGEFPVYSNAPEAVYIQSGRMAERIPLETTAVAGVSNVEFREQVDRMFSSVVQGRGVVVVFDLPWRAASYSVEDLISLGELAVAYQSEEGVILTAAGE
jgi:hypothetical protein